MRICKCDCPSCQYDDHDHCEYECSEHDEEEYQRNVEIDRQVDEERI